MKPNMNVFWRFIDSHFSSGALPHRTREQGSANIKIFKICMMPLACVGVDRGHPVRQRAEPAQF
jgi:hypothetical protein